MDALPDALCAALLCPFVPLRDRVDALAQVSRRWHTLAWRSIRSDRTLDLTWCTGDHELDRVITALAKSRVDDGIPIQLEAFRLYGPRVGASTLRRLGDAVGCTRVRRIELESKQIDDDALRQLGACSKMEVLTLRCVKLTSEALAHIAQHCTKLQVLDIAGCSRVCDAGVVTVATHCPQLRELDLSMCHRVSDRSIAAIALRKHKTLERVVVDRCLKISGLALRFLMKSQPALRHLSFAHCPRIQDHDFAALSKQLAKSGALLEGVDMSGCAMLGDQGVASLVTHSTDTLQTLSARALVRLSSVAFQCIAHCSKLTSLNLSMNRTLENADLRRIVASCVSLRSLKLQGCVQIDDDGAEAIACYGKRIETLSLEFCYNITDDGFAQIVGSCHRLEDLNVKALNQLTVDAFGSLIAVKSTAAALRRINIGALADFDTTLRYASIIKRRYPRARIEWT